MSGIALFYRLIVRPLFHEPVRTVLTIFAIALGVGVVLAIDLAGIAATHSFHSSLETLAGDNDLEITASGGISENAVGTLASLPFPIRISPRVEDYAVVQETNQTITLLGLDLIAEGESRDAASSSFLNGQQQDTLKYLRDYDSVWVGESLGRQPGDRIALLINDRVRTYVVRSTFSDSHGNASAILMDLAAAQQALGRFGRIDRVLIRVPKVPSLEDWQQRLRQVLPAGVEIRPAGASTNENRQMLGAFGWNLRLLSYIALVVGAFLIYNTISVSVVRRRAEIGILRALGASGSVVLAGFVGEAASFGLAGALIGLPLGRVMASGAVRLLGATVESLYVSSRPGSIELSGRSVALALIVGVGVAVASAYSPAREASFVAPVEAMARGRREYHTRVHKMRDLVFALLLGLSAAVAARAPAVAGKPLFGYLATLLLIIASALAIPAFTAALMKLSSRLLGKLLGVEALLASRSLAASLRRTSILVAALSTAVAMMISVGIMVGSFRQTVLLWIEDQLPADLYVRPAGTPAADRHPTISLALAEKIQHMPGVAAVDRLREYEISVNGKPATLASVELGVLRSYGKADFVSGRSKAAVLDELRNADAVLVSEPFANKHNVRTGDSIAIPLGDARPSFRVVDVFYDYGSERGSLVMDRNTVLKYLSDPAPSNLTIYVAPGASLEMVRANIEQGSAPHRVLVFSNRDLRGEALRIFDRTFAITYALEAVAVIVAVMGVAGAVLALVIDRRRELGLLRFLGAASGQIRKLILVETGLIGLLATLAGVVLGFAMSLILIFVINKQSFGWTIQFHWPVAVLLGALAAVYASTVLAGLYPASVAMRLNPMEVVHED